MRQIQILAKDFRTSEERRSLSAMGRIQRAKEVENHPKTFFKQEATPYLPDVKSKEMLKEPSLAYATDRGRRESLSS